MTDTEVKPKDWFTPTELLPAPGDVVWALDSSGTVRELAYQHGMWWTPDLSMYVYFTPIFWQEKS